MTSHTTYMHAYLINFLLFDLLPSNILSNIFTLAFFSEIPAPTSDFTFCMKELQVIILVHGVTKVSISVYCNPRSSNNYTYRERERESFINLVDLSSSPTLPFSNTLSSLLIWPCYRQSSGGPPLFILVRGYFIFTYPYHLNPRPSDTSLTLLFNFYFLSLDS